MNDRKSEPSRKSWPPNPWGKLGASVLAVVLTAGGGAGTGWLTAGQRISDLSEDVKKAEDARSDLSTAIQSCQATVGVQSVALARVETEQGAIKREIAHQRSDVAQDISEIKDGIAELRREIRRRR